MKTKKVTLTLDAELADAIKLQARTSNLIMKQVVNDAIRRGLSIAAEGTSAERHRIKPFNTGFSPGVDPEDLKGFLNNEDDERYSRLTYGDNSGR